MQHIIVNLHSVGASQVPVVVSYPDDDFVGFDVNDGRTKVSVNADKAYAERLYASLGEALGKA